MGGARLKLAWAAAAVLAMLGGATAQECPCGYVGEGCNTTGYVDEDGVTQLVEVTKFPNGTCVEENTFLCFVEEAEAFCACEFGYFGDFCQDQIEIKWATFISGGVVLPIIILAYGIYKTRKTAVDKVPLDALVSGRASKKQLFVYRAAILVFSLGILIHQAARNVRNGNFFRMFRFFTVWNFWLLTAYFTLATVFSFRAVFHPKSFEEKRSSRLERLLVIMMEVELPSTPFIALVVWGVLLPGALASGNTTGLLDFTSFVQHGINCFMMLGDFLLSGMRFQRSDFIFVVMWGSLYALVHSFVLIYETSVLDLPARPSYSILSPGLSVLPAILIGLVFVLTGAFMLCRCFNRCKPEYPTIEKTLSVNGATEDVESAQETAKPDSTQEQVDSTVGDEKEAEGTLEIKDKEELKEAL